MIHARSLKSWRWKQNYESQMTYSTNQHQISHANKSDRIKKDVRKIDIRRDPRSHKIKSLKALVRIDTHIINMTIDKRSPVSFLNWTTAKQLMEGATKIKFIPPEKLNLSTQFVDYKKQPIQKLVALCTSIRSAGGEVTDSTFLLTERRARCILGLDLQGKLGIQTTQKSAPSQTSRFDVLLCEQPEGRKNQFYEKFPSLFDRKGESKTHVVNTNIKYPLCPIQEKGRRIPIRI